MQYTFQLLLQFLFPSLTWRIKTKAKVLYLTFDDGPIPEVTPWVLEQLENYNAKATFFCIGDNVKKHPAIYQSISLKGHAIGNHTFTHLNAWRTDNIQYLEDTRLARQVIDSRLFRPPYGKITPALIQSLKKEYKIIMWDVLSYDFDIRFNGKSCMEKVIRHARPGSIIVFHDSIKAVDRLKQALPDILKHYSAKGYTFEKLQ